MPWRAWVRRTTLKLGLVGLVAGAVAPGAGVGRAEERPDAATPSAATVYYSGRAFRIPFRVDEAERSRLREVRLLVSEDSGFRWRLENKTTPDQPFFTFRAPRDAEYWFAVQTVDTEGRIYPADRDRAVEPSMKVVVDTTPPSLILEPRGRQGSRASVHWEARDEHLDLESLVLEYRAEGAAHWGQVPIRRRAPIGDETWDAGTAAPLKVRAAVADRAGNVQQVELSLPDGTASGPSSLTDLDFSDDPDQFAPPPPIPQRMASNARYGSERDIPPERFSRPRGSDNRPAPHDREWRTHDDWPATGRDDRASVPASRVPGGGQTQLINSPRFPLHYEVEDAGPDGPAVVELWVTRDGGRNWKRLGADPDRVSPFDVDLGGEGTFGLKLVARSSLGFGDQPPAPGEPPEIWVEVDTTPPTVELEPVLIGSGSQVGKVRVAWRASDANLAARPVLISWRADEPGAGWQPIERVENTGRFIWDVPPEVPDRFHLRLDVIDAAGNRAHADTTRHGPIFVDRARPRGRIIGLGDRGERR